MPGADEINTHLGISGEREYRDAMDGIADKLKILSSEMAKTSAAYDKNDKSVAALAARNADLESKLELQRQKVELCRKGLENANATWGEASERAQQWQKALNYAEAAVTRSEAAIRKNAEALEAFGSAADRINLDELTAQLQDVDAGLDLTGKKLEGARAKLEKSWSAKGFSDAQKLAQDAVGQTEQKADLLRRKLEELERLGTDKVSEEYRTLERELAQTENAAQRARDELERINQISVDQINEGFESAANILDEIGNILTVTVTTPLAAAGTAAVGFATNTAESVNKVEVAFGSAAGEVERFAETTLTAYGLARGTALDMAALYGDMATGMGIGQESAADMSQTLVGLAADLASFKNISIDTANTALKSIFTGETESLKSLGVVMTEANLKNYALAQGFKTTYAEMDQTEKVMLRLQYVLDVTKNAQGDFARTSGGTANQLRIFQESLKEAAATAGDELLPVVTPIISSLSELVQSFGELDEGTRKAVVQTALFAASLGPMLKLTGGLTTALNMARNAHATLAAAKAAEAAITANATAEQLALNAAMRANVIGMVITAVGALVAVLASLALSSGLMAEKTDDLNQKMRESKKAFEEATAAIETHREDTLSMVAALQLLAAEEGKSAAQKGAMLNLVDRLNEAVPDLALAYDAETDSLSLTAEAIRQIVIAESARQEQEAGAKRLADAYREEIALTEQLKTAKDDLLKAQADRASLIDGEVHTDAAYRDALYQVGVALVNAEQKVKELTEAQAENGAEIGRLKADFNKLTVSIDGTAESSENATAALQYFNTVLGELKGSYDILAKAQKEMTDTGYLSISTVSTMLEKYPELSGYLEEVEGGYRLTDGALKDYLATQRVEYQVAVDNADAAAQAVIAAEAEKRGAIMDTTQSIENQLLALAALYDATSQAIGTAANVAGRVAGSLTGLPAGLIGDTVGDAAQNASAKAMEQQAGAIKAALAEYRAAVESKDTFDRISASLDRDSSPSSKGSSKKAKTPAELDLEAYRAAVKKLDHLRAMEEITDEEYYRRKEKAGAQYLQNNLEEAQKLEEELYSYHQGAYERDLAELDKALKYKEITYEEHAAQVAALQSKHLTEGSDEWKESDALQAQDRRNAYEEKLAALDQALEDETISYQQHYEGLQALAGEAQALGEDAQRDHRKRMEQNRESAYDEELADQKYFLDMGIISEEQYYRALERLRDEYLEKDSDEWRRANVELKQYQDRVYKEALAALKEALDEKLDALKDAYDEEKTAIKDGYDAEKEALKAGYDAQKKAAKEAYEARKEAIKRELDLEKERLNGILEGIDAEIQARRELREDEDLDGAIAAAQKRLDAAKAQLEFARTDEDKQQWSDEIIRLEKALQEAVQKKEDTEFYREKELEKEGIRDQLDAAQKEADGKLDAAAKDYEAVTSRLEAQYNASVKRLEADYAAKLAQAEARYKEAVRELEGHYESAKSSVGGSAKDERYNQKEWSDEVRAISREKGVDLGVAQDMYNMDQRHRDDPDYKPYASGDYGKTAKAAMGAAMAGLATVVGATVATQVTRNNSARVVINQASGLTSGQIGAAVRKAVEAMDR